ncbi:MAG: hypothetical protein ACOVN2_07005, partial [Usitatibacteraceae bacterium]
DIRKFAVEDTATIELLDSANDPMCADDEGKLRCKIEVYGPGTRQYAKAQAGENNRMLNRLKAKGKAKQTPEEIAEERAEFLKDVTKSFTNIEYDGLEGPELFKAVYLDRTIGFIADQVKEHLGDWANFTKSSTPN